MADTALKTRREPPRFHARLFIAQSTLERWLDSGNAEMQQNLVLLRKSRKTYRLEPAVRFLSSLTGASAPNLVGKVLSEARIVELGGELMGDSVLFGDAAFQVAPGYVGTLEPI